MQNEILTGYPTESKMEEYSIERKEIRSKGETLESFNAGGNVNRKLGQNEAHREERIKKGGM